VSWRGLIVSVQMVALLAVQWLTAVAPLQLFVEPHAPLAECATMHQCGCSAEARANHTCCCCSRSSSKNSPATAPHAGFLVRLVSAVRCNGGNHSDSSNSPGLHFDFVAIQQRWLPPVDQFAGRIQPMTETKSCRLLEPPVPPPRLLGSV
jgi:hypothetical protein